MTLSLPITIISAHFDEEARQYARVVQSQKRIKARQRAEGTEDTTSSPPAPGPEQSPGRNSRARSCSAQRLLLEQYGLAGLDDTLADFRESVRSGLEITLQRMERDLQDHVRKIVMLSNVFASRRRLASNDDNKNVYAQTEMERGSCDPKSEPAQPALPGTSM